MSHIKRQPKFQQENGNQKMMLACKEDRNIRTSNVYQVREHFIGHEWQDAFIGGGVLLEKIWVGMCGLLSKTVLYLRPKSAIFPILAI